MTFRASGTVRSFQSWPQSEQVFNFSDVSWTYSFVGFGSPSKAVRDSHGTLSIMRRTGIEDFLSDLMERGERARRHLEDGAIAVAWYYRNDDENISECHFLIGLDDDGWLAVAKDLRFAWSNDLKIEVSAFGGFADREAPDARVVTPDQFERGEALLLDAPRIVIGSSI